MPRKTLAQYRLPGVLGFAAALLFFATVSGAQEVDAPDPSTKPAAPLVRTVPDLAAERRQQLRKQYPQEDLLGLSTGTTEFQALWRKDQSGEAYGAVLIIPGDGQTANWPDTIEVLRQDLPLNGWNTLAIDIEEQPLASPGSRQNQTVSTDELEKIKKQTEEKNQQRLRAAFNYLNNEGQYNIILIAYGNSAPRVLAFVNGLDVGATKPSLSKTKVKMNHPIRTLVFINAHGEQADHDLSSLSWKDIPILDIFFETHALEDMESKMRASAALNRGFGNYYQIKMLEPTTTVFNKENRLSRRVRGFLDKHARGIEIERY